ncbi:MAG TPA: DUF2207 domain-containing protein [Roseococcus sp.]|nr:DUF2207 domain-containing protein [Roseococcus sp.]
MIRWLLALLLWLAAGAAAAQPVEVIRDFSQRIEIQADGSVEVVEEIEVVALGHTIRRGIYRDLRLRALDPAGFLKAGFTLHEATRNGQPETSRVEGTGRGVRIWLGHPDVLLPHGVHRYRLRYRVEEEIRAFAGFDELYWNVNGTEWVFPTLRVTAEVLLPERSTVLQHAAYTGRAGERGRDFRVTRPGPRRIAFATTRPLAAGENLTIAVAFPAGVVVHTDRHAWLRWLLWRDPLEVGGGLLVLLLAYYGAVWWRVGRDPPRGTIIPIYHPSLPPAAMRYIERMAFDRQCTAAALLSLAVKGHLTMAKDAKGEMTLARATPRPGAPEPSVAEGVLLAQLLGGRSHITLSRANQKTLAAAQLAFRRQLDRNFNRVFFNWNSGWSWLGILFTVLGWLVVSLTQPNLLEAAPLLLVVGVVGGVLILVPWQFVIQLRRWRATGRLTDLLGAGVLLLVCAMILGLLGGVALFTMEFLGWRAVVAALALIAVNMLFLHLLRAPTAEGRRALDEIEGTRLYLTVAEADRLRFHNPPDRTPAHFEAMLPYAVALGVETAWTVQFSEVLARADRGEQGSYRPGWYAGGGFDTGDLAGLGTSLADSYGTASAPASSGSGGGGSSGGGGGGGGGGGW